LNAIRPTCAPATKAAVPPVASQGASSSSGGHFDRALPQHFETCAFGRRRGLLRARGCGGEARRDDHDSPVYGASRNPHAFIIAASRDATPGGGASFRYLWHIRPSSVIDFGSQFTQLIARRLRELSVYAEIVPPRTTAAQIASRRPVGIILSGGPSSVSDAGAPHVDAGIFALGVPTLGICYGMQLMTYMLGGVVSPAASREYGHAVIHLSQTARLFNELPESVKAWASHGDYVASAPPGFQVTATSENAPVAAMQNLESQLYGLLFPPGSGAHRAGRADVAQFRLRRVRLYRGLDDGVVRG
jgi:GMP synthase (glutamine-hydrolysing) A subunit